MRLTEMVSKSKAERGDKTPISALLCSPFFIKYIFLC